MSKKQCKVTTGKEVDIIDKIKRDIEFEFLKKGIRVSCMNLNLNSDSISLNILLSSNRRLA
ncbi:hypothetical protein [Ruminiclostridium cellulolyticum]|uniref:Uncharacterized protein n=1 Tax=Ruminiclostridium cellulolyticum (strain ATCC 35319 / DSM 5812 / JCM 6584 / H10) TaxID=394503 RepID=B8I199_RUMCH|nr:hypothetical protein [Ruminiclostridium cellulolyticum]ACL75697.1 hypothetical protein Ccel_1343 [Ruminiclostridium cellulolyticum H10]